LAKSEQDQDARGGSVAIQSGGDTTISTGLSTDQLKGIIECVADQIPKFVQIAGGLVDQRLREFEEKIVDRFSSDKEAKAEVFQDPDFLFVVRQAQTSYARTGDETLGENLADLIAERSQTSSRSRASLILNEAISKVSALTREEFAVLTVDFVIRRTKSDASNIHAVANFLNIYVSPFIDDVPVENSSYLYLESLGCGKMSVGSMTLESALTQTYQFLVRSVPRGPVEDATSSRVVDSLVAAGLIHQPESTELRIDFDSKESFDTSVADAGFNDVDTDAIWSHGRGSSLDKAGLIEALSKEVPKIELMFEKWEQSPLRHFELSAVGLAIAYSHLKRAIPLTAPISIWVN
jgi:hypothetical protein